MSKLQQAGGRVRHAERRTDDWRTGLDRVGRLSDKVQLLARIDLVHEPHHCAVTYPCGFVPGASRPERVSAAAPGSDPGAEAKP
jgi:hypothetical protein